MHRLQVVIQQGCCLPIAQLGLLTSCVKLLLCHRRFLGSFVSQEILNRRYASQAFLRRYRNTLKLILIQ